MFGDYELGRKLVLVESEEAKEVTLGVGGDGDIKVGGVVLYGEWDVLRGRSFWRGFCQPLIPYNVMSLHGMFTYERGLMSRNARVFSLSKSFIEGMSPVN